MSKIKESWSPEELHELAKCARENQVRANTQLLVVSAVCDEIADLLQAGEFSAAAKATLSLLPLALAIATAARAAAVYAAQLPGSVEASRKRGGQ